MINADSLLTHDHAKAQVTPTKLMAVRSEVRIHWLSRAAEDLTHLYEHIAQTTRRLPLLEPEKLYRRVYP